MAANDALSFYVKFYEDTQHNINGLIRQLQGKLENLTIHLKAENINISGLEKALSNIKPVQVVDKTDLNSVVNKIGDVKRLLSDAFSTSEKGAKFPGVLESLDNIRKEIERVVSAVGDLKAALTRDLSANIGNGIVNNMVQIVESTGKAIAAVQKLNDEVGKGKKTGGKTEKQEMVPPTISLATTNFKNEADNLIKVYEDTEKRMKDKIKNIQETVDKFPKDTFIKNPANRQWLQQEMDDVEKLQRHLMSLLGVIEKFSAATQTTKIVKFDEPIKQMSQQERDERQWMYSYLFNTEKAVKMQNGVDTDGIEKAKQKAVELWEELEKINNAITRTNDQNLLQGATAAYDRLEQIYANLRNIAQTGSTRDGRSWEEYSKGTDIKGAVSEGKKVVAEIDAAAKKAEEKVLKANREQADAEIQRLKGYQRELKKLQSEGLSKVKDKDAFKNSAGYKEIENAIKQLEEYINKLKQVKSAGQQIGSIDLGNFKVGEADATMARLSQSRKDAIMSANELAQAQQRMGQAIQTANDKASQQSQILSDLKSMAAQYLSVWGASNFVKEVAQITGELELQQKSLEVIIGSAGKAQELYNDIKGMSQMSPYTFQDLMKTTKQLAAFGIETKDLFGTMKQLSDIGAGLDVDVQRLVLAYGHIKSAGVLTGIQRRQLETAGIGITAELAKLYNDQYRAAGSDERVSAEDVFKRIKDRQVSFEDVEKVFNRLTGPGGKFYEMQLKQYDTLGGKLRNLRNNYNIMMDEIGKAHHSLLTGGVDALNSLMESWRKWQSVIEGVLWALGAVKAAQLVIGKMGLTGATAHRAANLERKASLREMAMIGAVGSGSGGSWYPNMRKDFRNNPLGINYAQNVLDSPMNKFQKARAVMYSNVTREARKLLLVELGFKEAYAQNVAGMKGWQLGFERLKIGARSFFATMRAGFAAMLSNPFTWIFAAVAAITSIVSGLKEMKRTTAEIRKNIRESEEEDIKSISSVLNPIQDRLNYKFNAKEGINLDVSVNTEDAREIIEQLDAELQKHDPLYEGHMFNLEQIRDEAERAKAMILEVESVRQGKQEVEDRAGEIAKAIEDSDATWGWGDNLASEFKEQEENLVELRESIKRNQDVRKDIERFIKDFDGMGYTSVDDMKKLLEYWDKNYKNKGYDFDTYFYRLMRSGQFSSDSYDQVIKNYLHLEGTGMYNDEIKSNFAALRKKMESQKKVFQNGFKSLLDKGDFSGKERAAFMVEAVEKILSTDKYAISDPEMKKYFSDWMYRYIVANFQGGEEGLNDLMQNVYPAVLEARAGQDTSNFLTRLKQSGKYNLDNLSQQDIAEITRKFNEDVYFNAVAGVNQKFAPQIAEAYNKAFRSALRGIDVEEADLEPWQQKIKTALGLVRFDEVKARLKIDVGAEADLEEFANAVRKAYKEAKEKAILMAQTLKINTKLNLNIDAIVSAGNLKQLNSLRASLLGLAQNQINSALNKYGMGSPELKSAADSANQIKKFVESLDIFMDALKANDATGYDFTTDPKDVEKQRKNEEAARRKAEAGRRKQEEAENKAREKARKQFENEIDAISKLQREYRRLRSQGYNEEAAMTETESYFNRMFKGKGIINWDKINKEDITSVGTYLKNMGGRIDASKLNKEEKDRLKTRALEQIMQNENQDLTDKSNEIIAEFNTQMDELTERFNTLRKVMDSTGMKDYAGLLSGLGEQAAIAGRLSGLIEGMLDQRLMMYYQQKGISPDKQKEIDYAKVALLSEKGIEDYVSKEFGNKETIDVVKSITSALKEYRKAIKEEQRENVEATVKAISAAKDYYTQLKLLESQTKRQNDLIEKMVGLSPDQQAELIQRNNADRDLKKIMLEPTYARFMRGDTTLDLAQVNNMVKRLSDAYRALFSTGGISTDELVQKLDEIMKNRRTYFSNRTEELMDISTKGRIERELKKLLADFFKIAEDAEKAKDKKERAIEKKSEAQVRYDMLNSTYKLNLDKGAEARRLEKEAKSTNDPALRKALEQQAAQLRAEIATNEVSPTEIREAKEAVDKADMEIKAADIILQGYKKPLQDKADEIDNKNNEAQSKSDWAVITTKAVEHLKKFSDALSFVQSVLDSFGVEATALEDVVSVIGGATQGAETGLMVGDMLGGLSSALGNAGPWGAAAGAALGIAGQLAQIHDKNLQRRIDEIKLDTTKMSNTLESIKSLRERQFGYDTGELRRMLGSLYAGGSNTNIDIARRNMNRASLAMGEYYARYSGGSGYEQELNLLEEQRKKIMEMYNLEDSKKKKSKEDLEDYKKQIADLDEQIHFFVVDLAKELWSIDLKSWADQFGDALMTAFENGTSAAAAFKDTVQDIMRGVVKSMLVTGVIEPAMQKLSDKLFGKDGNGGLLNLNDPKGSIGAVLAELGNWFNTEGPALMDAANEFYNGADNMMRQTLGYGMRENERSENTVNSIQSAASEETMGVVAGYLSRISQDVSVQRIMQEMFVNGSWPSYIEQVTSANNSLTAIDRSTTAMMEMMRDGNGALYERVENMSRRLDNFANGIDRIYIN